MKLPNFSWCGRKRRTISHHRARPPHSNTLGLPVGAMTSQAIHIAVMRLAAAIPVPAQSQVQIERPEVMRLCDKWDGILIATQRSGPVYLRCDQIKIQFDKFAQRGALFKTLRP